MQKLIKSRGPLLILYGSTYGMSQGLASTMAMEAKQKGFQQKVLNIGDYVFNDLKRETQPIVFLLSTYGDGGPTKDAELFLRDLKSSTESLQNLNYSIFGLGNSSFQNFAGMAVQTDQKLQELNANRVLDLGKGDAHKQTTEKDFSQWREQLWPLLEQKYKLFDTTQEEILKSRLTFIIKSYKKDQSPQEINPKNLNQQDLEKIETKTRQLLEAPAYTISSIVGLKKQVLENQTQCYKISLNNEQNQNIDYVTAQNVDVYPQNTQENVEKMAGLLGLDLNMIFDLEMSNENIKKPFPTPISVQTFLQNYCDLKGIVSKAQLYNLTELMEDEKEAQKYQEMTTFENEKIFQEEILKQKHSLLTLVEKLKLKPSLENFIMIANRISPRSYTISSSSSYLPNQIDLTISIMNENGRLGQFGSYLTELQKNYEGKQVRMNFVDSPFKYPQEDDVPIICVSTSSGIGPFRAFWQEKQHLNRNNSLTNYFGCRDKDQDVLYQDEIEKYTKEGIINNSRIAYSCENNGNKKKYIQDLILEDYETVGDIMFNKGGKMYLCGNSLMINEVIKNLGTIMNKVKKVPVFMTLGKIAKMKEDGFILTELQK